MPARTPRWPLVALALLPLVGCQTGSQDATFDAPQSAESSSSGAAPSESRAVGDGADAMAPPASPADTVAAKRITTGEATVEVARVDRARAALLDAARRAGGYVGNEEAWDTETSRSTRLTLRLPAARAAAFDTVLADLGRVTRRSTQVEDVTAQYVDVDARLRARRAVEARYVELLAQARSVADVVTVEEKLAAIREEIESAEGRLRLWDRQVAYSTLTVTLEEPRAVAGRNLAGRIGDALSDGWTMFVAFLLGLLRLWPFAVAVPLLVWAWRRLRIRLPRRRERPVRPVTPTDPPSASA